MIRRQFIPVNGASHPDSPAKAWYLITDCSSSWGLDNFLFVSLDFCHWQGHKLHVGLNIVFFKVRDLVPESQAYMDLLAFERKLDATIMRKRLDIQEALKRPMKVGWLFILKQFSDNLST